MRWYQQDVSDTGGVPLTGYKLYYFKQTTDPPVDVVLSASTLAWDGTGRPEVTEFVVTGLDADSDYSFVVTALNPYEGPQSNPLTVRAAGFPVAPASITEVAGSRTGHSIGLQWPAPTDNGGSAVVSYTLAIFRENQEDQVVYHGISLTAVVEGLTAGTEY